MYKTLFAWLLLVVWPETVPVRAQEIGTLPDREATLSTRRHAPRATAPASIKTVKHGPDPEPALPDSRTNPVPAALADRPTDTLLRRKKLRVRFRT